MVDEFACDSYVDVYLTIEEVTLGPYQSKVSGRSFLRKPPRPDERSTGFVFGSTGGGCCVCSGEHLCVNGICV
jgi:hypothetical protein